MQGKKRGDGGARNEKFWVKFWGKKLKEIGRKGLLSSQAPRRKKWHDTGYRERRKEVEGQCSQDEGGNWTSLRRREGKRTIRQGEKGMRERGKRGTKQNVKV